VTHAIQLDLSDLQAKQFAMSHEIG